MKYGISEKVARFAEEHKKYIQENGHNPTFKEFMAYSRATYNQCGHLKRYLKLGFEPEPVKLSEMYGIVARMHAEYQQEHGEDPMPSDIANACSISRSYAREVMRKQNLPFRREKRRAKGQYWSLHRHVDTSAVADTPADIPEESWAVQRSMVPDRLPDEGIPRLRACYFCGGRVVGHYRSDFHTWPIKEGNTTYKCYVCEKCRLQNGQAQKEGLNNGVNYCGWYGCIHAGRREGSSKGFQNPDTRFKARRYGSD